MNEDKTTVDVVVNDEELEMLLGDAGDHADGSEATNVDKDAELTAWMTTWWPNLEEVTS